MCFRGHANSRQLEHLEPRIVAHLDRALRRKLSRDVRRDRHEQVEAAFGDCQQAPPQCRQRKASRCPSAIERPRLQRRILVRVVDDAHATASQRKSGRDQLRIVQMANVCADVADDGFGRGEPRPPARKEGSCRRLCCRLPGSARRPRLNRRQPSAPPASRRSQRRPASGTPSRTPGRRADGGTSSGGRHGYVTAARGSAQAGECARASRLAVRS